MPYWWPMEDPHISFAYNYENSFDSMSCYCTRKKLIEKPTATLTNLKLVRATGHFDKHWMVIDEKIRELSPTMYERLGLPRRRVTFG